MAGISWVGTGTYMWLQRESLLIACQVQRNSNLEATETLSPQLRGTHYPGRTQTLSPHMLLGGAHSPQVTSAPSAELKSHLQKTPGTPTSRRILKRRGPAGCKQIKAIRDSYLNKELSQVRGGRTLGTLCRTEPLT